jgi:predicted anti-sigma-YlaC factor YlaD
MRFLPTCREIHRLASERLDRQLSFGEKGRLRMHLFMCSACRNFDGQMQLIRLAMHRMAATEEPVRETDPE